MTRPRRRSAPFAAAVAAMFVLACAPAAAYAGDKPVGGGRPVTPKVSPQMELAAKRFLHLRYKWSEEHPHGKLTDKQIKEMAEASEKWAAEKLAEKAKQEQDKEQGKEDEGEWDVGFSEGERDSDYSLVELGLRDLVLIGGKLLSEAGEGVLTAKPASPMVLFDPTLAAKAREDLGTLGKWIAVSVDVSVEELENPFGGLPGGGVPSGPKGGVIIKHHGPGSSGGEDPFEVPTGSFDNGEDWAPGGGGGLEDTPVGTQELGSTVYVDPDTGEVVGGVIEEWGGNHAPSGDDGGGNGNEQTGTEDEGTDETGSGDDDLDEDEGTGDDDDEGTGDDEGDDGDDEDDGDECEPDCGDGEEGGDEEGYPAPDDPDCGINCNPAIERADTQVENPADKPGHQGIVNPDKDGDGVPDEVGAPEQGHVIVNPGEAQGYTPNPGEIKGYTPGPDEGDPLPPIGMIEHPAEITGYTPADPGDPTPPIHTAAVSLP